MLKLMINNNVNGSVVVYPMPDRSPLVLLSLPPSIDALSLSLCDSS